LISGALFGACAKQEISFAAEFADGRKFMATTDGETLNINADAAAWEKARLTNAQTG